MSSAAVAADRLVRIEVTRTRSRMLAYQSIAGKVGMSADWLRKLLRDGAMRVDAVVRDRLQSLLVRELEAEIARLTNELEIARQTGAHLACEQVGEIETHLAKARALLNGNAS